jgi:molybdopterin/thiamine biosynthesis adenylyltransferase
MEKSWLCRQEGLISGKGQRAIANANVAVAGLGGVGGICADLLVRAGIGGLSVADFDKFDKTNLNRQINSSLRTIGKNKVAAFASLAKSINPKIKIKKTTKKINGKNASSFVSGCDIVIDCLDNIHSRVCFFRACKMMGIPYVYAAATGERGMVSVFSGNANLESILHLPSKNKQGNALAASLVKYPSCRNAWGPATNLAGVIAANQALNFLLGKPYARAPKMLALNSFSEKIIREEKL